MSSIDLPGPGRILFLRRHPETFLKIAERYGDYVSFRVGPRQVFLVSRPDLIERVFFDYYTAFEKDWGPRRGASPLGEGLLSSEGAAHRAQRLDYSRIFARPAVEARRAEVATAVHAWSAAQRDGAEIDVYRAMSRIASDVVGRVLFGCSLAHEEVIDAISDVSGGFGRFMFPHAGRFRLRRDRGARLRRLVRHIHEHTTRTGLIDPHAAGDDQIATFLVTGQETVRIATTWAWLLLGQHPEFASADSGNVLLEAMRLYPPQWMIGRRTIAPYDLGGSELPPGSLVLISPYVVHRDARLFAVPLAFDPDRWSTVPTHRFAYFPFGGGPRRCIGESFAMMMGTMILSLIRETWRLETRPGSLRYDASLTLHPRNTMARLRRTTSSA